MKEKIEKVSEFKWVIPKSTRKEMNVDAVIYANQFIFDTAEETALQQLTNVACLPGILEPVIAMPDMHWGYGLPMGAIGAFDKDNGVISCGCTGYDINCGVHMLKTNLTRKEVVPKIKKLIDTLFNIVPCGVGTKSKIRLTEAELDQVLVKGARWAIENGYGTPEGLKRMEESGSMAGADPDKISPEAKRRGAPQLGTLGAGNHFLEIQAVDVVYDKETAGIYGLDEPNQVVIMVHCGSRGLGHQVATDYLRIHKGAAAKYGIWLPDPQLVCAPASSQEGQEYLAAIRGAANYAFCNRQIIAHWIREGFESVFGGSWESLGMDTVYDVVHNICKLEEHMIDEKKQEV